jgi:hypothetical protein
VVCSSKGKEHANDTASDAAFREHAVSKSRANFQGIWLPTIVTAQYLLSAESFWCHV